MAKDLRTYLAQIKDRMLTISKPVDIRTQMGGLCMLVDRPVTFDNVVGYPGWTVVDYAGRTWPGGRARDEPSDTEPRESALGRLLSREWSWWSGARGRCAVVHVSGLWFEVQLRQLFATPADQAQALAEAMSAAVAAGQTGQSYFELVESRLVGAGPSFVVRPVQRLVR